MTAGDANRLGRALSLHPARLDRRCGAPQHWQASAIQRLHVVTPSEPLPSLRARPFLAGLLATRPAFLGVTLCACLIGLAVALVKDLRADPLMVRQQYAKDAVEAAVVAGVTEHGDDFVIAVERDPDAR